MVQSVTWRPIWAATVGLAVALALCGSCRSSGPGQSSPSKANAAGFLKAHGLEGRVALLQFGAMGCPLSAEGLEKMTALRNDRKDQRFTGVAFARVEAAAQSPAATDYFAAQAPGFPVYYDPGSVIGRAFKATVVPTYVLVDKFGRVRYRGLWPEEESLTAWTAELAGQTADAGPTVARFGGLDLDAPTLLAETRLPDLAGATKRLCDYLGVKGLVVLFVDKGCPFAGVALKEVPQVAPALAGRGLPIVIVNVGDSKDVVRTFYGNLHLGLPIVYDTTTATQERWLVTSVPTVVLLDDSGRMVFRGPAVWKNLGTAADDLLQQHRGAITFPVAGTEFG